MTPHPKPSPKSPRPRKPMKRSRLKPRKRSASEFSRIYGSEERVEWVKRQPCAVPGCVFGPCENAHTENGGTGRKANAETIVPLCGKHHFILHMEGKATFEEAYAISLARRAEYTAHRWQSHISNNQESP